MSFENCYPSIIASEGGFVNDPRDNGGMTMLGVTSRNWQAFTGKPSTEAVMRALTPAKVAPFYRANYWDTVAGDQLPSGLALCVFDFAVNSGPGRSARLLQKVVGAAADGKIGPASIRAVYAAVKDTGEATLIRRFQNARRDFYRALDDFDHFGKGWLRRCDRVETEALRIIK